MGGAKASSCLTAKISRARLFPTAGATHSTEKKDPFQDEERRATTAAGKSVEQLHPHKAASFTHARSRSERQAPLYSLTIAM